MREITYDDYLKLRGLAVLAYEHTKALDAIVVAAAKVAGVEAEDRMPNYFGHLSDVFYETRDLPNIDAMLATLEITVEEPAHVG